MLTACTAFVPATEVARRGVLRNEPSVSRRCSHGIRRAKMVAPSPSPRSSRPSQAVVPRTSRANANRHANIQIYDTTLRDGTQGEGISLSVADKIKVANALDQFGVAYIEGGWPGANPKDDKFFELRPQDAFQNARLVAFGMTRSKGSSCEKDAHVKALLDAGAPVVTLVAKASQYHVESVLETTIEENLAMIRDTVDFFKRAGREVMIDAEHFFDGYKASPEYAIRCLRAATSAGADGLVLCDTNGGSLPNEIERATRHVALEFPDARVGIHTHNDCELAVANALAAVVAGATLVQGTCNGYGERTGNANLSSIIPTLQLKMQRNCIAGSLSGLTGLSRFVEEVANQRHVSGRPFVGASSFAHKGGLHAAAVLKLPDSYQHIDPADVGNERRVLVSELSGRKNIVSKAVELGLLTERSDEDTGNGTSGPGGVETALEAVDWSTRATEVLRRVKELESKGYAFEGAEASVELMIRRTLRGYRPPFALLDYTILTGSKRLGDGSDAVTQATIKLALMGPGEGTDACPTKTCLEVGEGEGPIDAFHKALSHTLFEVYHPLRSVVLADYKVRILDNENGTAATTRVMVDFKDNSNGKRWTTVCAHSNIITASVNALMDGFEFAMIHKLPQCVL